METEFEPARVDDVDELLRLFRLIYGTSYALPIGTDGDVMARTIASERTMWLVERNSGRIVASIMGTIEPSDRMGKMQALIVDPNHRGGGIANRMVGDLAKVLLATGEVDSVYGTARTTSAVRQAPQSLGPLLKTVHDVVGLPVFPELMPERFADHVRRGVINPLVVEWTSALDTNPRTGKTIRLIDERPVV